MSAFNPGDLKREVKGKADPSLVKPSKGAFGMQVHGLKSATKVLKKGPSALMAESMEKQKDFIRERILDNAPASLKNLKSSLKLEIKQERGKVTMLISAKNSKGIRAHEDPDAGGDGLASSPTEEGGKGSKFITRVFDTHAKKLRDENLKAVAEGFAGSAKKSKGKG